MSRQQEIEALIGPGPDMGNYLNVERDEALKGVLNESERIDYLEDLSDWERQRADIEQARAERWKQEMDKAADMLPPGSEPWDHYVRRIDAGGSWEEYARGKRW